MPRQRRRLLNYERPLSLSHSVLRTSRHLPFFSSPTARSTHPSLEKLTTAPYRYQYYYEYYYSITVSTPDFIIHKLPHTHTHTRTIVIVSKGFNCERNGCLGVVVSVRGGEAVAMGKNTRAASCREGDFISAVVLSQTLRSTPKAHSLYSSNTCSVSTFLFLFFYMT